MIAACIAAPARCAELLTGDWCGNRDWLAERGVTFDLDVAHFHQGVAARAIASNRIGLRG